MTAKKLEAAYKLAKDRYAELGVDTDAARRLVEEEIGAVFQTRPLF